ncbi:MAG: efflux RND transporter permease subunit [Gammaproteobacteria bacterium]|nr:efflux RND transporter permease subunit [Gammaproteobacteria bacterium]
MNITEFAIRRNRVFFAVLVTLIAGGLFTYQSMPRSEDPGFIFRFALVQTLFPGASPERVEMLVTDKLEKVIQEIPEIDFIRSQSKTGVSLIFVSIKAEYTDMRPIWDNLRRKVERGEGDLPDGIVGPFVNDEFGDVFGSLIAITGDGFDYRELKDVADEVRDELLLIDETAKVEIVGDQEERVFVVFDNSALADLNLSPIQLMQALQARNIIMPGGDLATQYEKIVFEPSGNFESVEDLRRTVVALPGSDALVRLEDLLSIERGYVDPPATMARYNGEPALILAVSLKDGGNIVRLAERIRAVLDRAQRVYPVGIDFDIVYFQADSVEDKIRMFTSNLLQAVALVALVMLIFLKLRTALIVSSLIPATMIIAFLVMDQFGIGLDQMSLAALIISLGMLVDNAIVMSESIIVRLGRGEEALSAAVASARELRFPLLTSSLTTAAAFLPIFLSESETGEYTAPLFKVVTITLLCSWVLALTLIPALCVKFLRVEVRPDVDPLDRPAYQIYRRSLLAMLRRPWLSLAGAIAIFAITLQGFAFIPQLFYPPNDAPTFTVDLELPVGTPIERTDEVMASIERFMLDNLMAGNGQGGIKNWSTYIGEGAPRFNLPYEQEQRSPHYAFMLGHVSDNELLDERLFSQIEQYVLNTFPDANITVRPLPLGPPAWPPVAIRIIGRDTNQIFDLVDRVKAKLETVPGTKQITDSWGARTKKVVFNIDETRARLAGLSNQDIAISMQAYVSGMETTEFREDDKLIPVVLRSRAAQQADTAGIASMNVYSQATGQSVPLSQVATPEIVWQPGVIERRNRLRNVTVESLLEPGYTAAEINTAMRPWLEQESKGWPFGYSWEFGGEAETSGKANESIAAKIPVGMMIIVLLLVAQFNSIRRPIIVLMTIPFALIGVIIGLLVARSYFGFMTFLGVISLAGIVINNAIVLLDRIRIEKEENGLEITDAMLLAAQQRLRPILLTTATTIGGLLPLWLGGGPMWEPMAVAIIFGLAFATVLTLGLVPVLYALLYRVDFRAYQNAAVS